MTLTHSIMTPPMTTNIYWDVILANICPVARFHMLHGACAHRICWLGNARYRGLQQSAGIMINYLYEPAKLADRQQFYMRHMQDTHIRPPTSSAWDF